MFIAFKDWGALGEEEGLKVTYACAEGCDCNHRHWTSINRKCAADIQTGAEQHQ